MSKPLTLDDLLRELGELMAVDLAAHMQDVRDRQAEEAKQMQLTHQRERKAIEVQMTEVNRRTVELREAIKLARDGMDALQAIMQTKGTAEFVMVGGTMMWTIPPRDN